MPTFGIQARSEEAWGWPECHTQRCLPEHFGEAPNAEEFKEVLEYASILGNLTQKLNQRDTDERALLIHLFKARHGAVQPAERYWAGSGKVTRM